MTTISLRSFHLRLAGAAVTLALFGAACGGDELPSRSKVIKTLEEAGIEGEEANCVADKLEKDEKVLREAVDGKQPGELVDMMTECLLNPSSESEADASEPSEPTADDAAEESTEESSNTTVESITLPTNPPPVADTAVQEAAGDDSALIKTWQDAATALNSSPNDDKCAIGEALQVWGDTPFPTTRDGLTMLNIFETSMLAAMPSRFTAELSTDDMLAYSAAINGLLEANSQTDFQAALQADSAAFETVKGNMIDVLTAAGC
jgi:hypothetical protein